MRNSFIRLLLFSIICMFCLPGSLLAKQEKVSLHPKNIMRVAWINNNELLIVDGDEFIKRNQNQRLLKYSVKTNSFSGLINEKFEEDLSIDFSSNGKTLLIFNNKSRVLKLISEGKVTFSSDLSGLYNELIRNQGINEVSNFHLTPIKTLKNSAIVKIKVKGKINGFIDTVEKVHFINRQEINFDQNNEKWIHDEPVHSTYINDDENLYVKYYKKPLNENAENLESYLGIINLRTCDAKYIKIADEDVGLRELQSFKNKILYIGYLPGAYTALDSLSGKGSRLILLDPVKNKTVILFSGLNAFAVSDNYVVTATAYRVYRDLYLTQSLLEYKIYDKTGFLLFGKYVNEPGIDKIVEYPLFPLITPDQKKIVIIKCYKPEKPVIINTKDLPVTYYPEDSLYGPHPWWLIFP